MRSRIDGDGRGRRLLATVAFIGAVTACHVALVSLSNGSFGALLSVEKLYGSTFLFCGPFALWLYGESPFLTLAVACALAACYVLLIWATRYGHAPMVVHVLVPVVWFVIGSYVGPYGGKALGL